jgi:hypothetical protein
MRDGLRIVPLIVIVALYETKKKGREGKIGKETTHKDKNQPHESIEF